MIGSYNCPITGVRYAAKHPITNLQINFRAYTAVLLRKL